MHGSRDLAITKRQNKQPNLPPKVLNYISWQHSNFGQPTMNGDFFLWNFHTIGAQGPTIFITFYYMVKKLLYDVSFSIKCGNPGNYKNFFKYHFFKKYKFEIGILDLDICGKLWIIPFLLMTWKLKEF